VVRCPTCSGQVVVPTPGPGEEDSVPQPPEPPAAGPPPAPRPDLFERSSFGEEFLSEDEPNVGSTAGRRAGLKPVPPPEAPRPVAVEPERLAPPVGTFNAVAAPSAPGIFLTPVKVTILAVLVVLLIGVAFFAGMLVGRS
jgi:hypothetical protein